MPKSPSFWVSNFYWWCHRCGDGPNNQAFIASCMNVTCQHKRCPQCELLVYKHRNIPDDVDRSVSKADPNQPSSSPRTRPANPLESGGTTSGPEENRDSRSASQRAPVMPTSVPAGNWNFRELATREDSTSDSEISSVTGPQVTPPSDTSSEDGTNPPWQADLVVVSSVARRLVDDWAGQYQTAGSPPASGITTHAGGSRGSETPVRRSQRNSASSQDFAGTLKRGNNPDGNNDGTNEESQKRRRQEAIPDPDEIASIVRLLACPYHKYDPQRYSERNVTEKEYRGCASCYIIDINRLKQHLYRVHQKPDFCCNRCFVVFVNTTLFEDHTRQEPACDVLEQRFTERMTEDQFRNIKRKQRGRNDEEKWFRIFGILFPDATPPESPYLGDDTVQAGLSDFVRYFRQHAPAMLNSEVRSRITSTIDLGFQEEYLLDLILHDATTRVVQRLTTDHSLGRRHETARPDTPEAGL